MNKLLKYTFGLLFLLAFVSLEAKERPKRKKSNRPVKQESSLRAQCQKAKKQVDMEINNVRAKLLTGGDLWWDGTNGKYIVPKPLQGSDAPEVSSLYAGGVWIGGLDNGGNLKLAASTFPSGDDIDYYTGPLDVNTGTTELEICQDWDRFFEVTGIEIEQHIFNFSKGLYENNCDLIPDGVKYWPAKGNPYFAQKYGFKLPSTSQAMAGFHDVGELGVYNPCEGDYPIIEIRGCNEPIFPDDMFFWVYNDQGGPHTETFGEAIQMEVQVQSFAFVGNDEVNDMTFYRYKLINRADDDILETYFAMWIDPDLGCSLDDYVGCDTTKVTRINKDGGVELVSRDLMFLYNEDGVDGEPGISCDGVPTYEYKVPMLGIDYFRGPKRPYTRDEDGNLHPTQAGESQDTSLEIGMSSFVYYNNIGGENESATEDPEFAEEYYNYLTGKWKDGTPFTSGGTGYNPGSTDTTQYAYTGDPSDPLGWSMCSTSAPSGDRRTLQVTGPLLLIPGATNELIIGAVWVPNIDYPCPNLNRLLYADGLAQALFDNCFDRLEGPRAPEMCGIELDQELILVLTNDTSELNNNRFEQYTEVDIFGKDIPGDSLYRFEGYKVFQLKNQNVSVQDLDDIDNARLVRQVDLKNGVGTIYNWSPIDNPNGSQDIWTYEEMVDGADSGLNHTFQILTDAFADGDNRLVNHKEYHYLVLAYAHNRKDQLFDPEDPQAGQRTEYIEGVKGSDGQAPKVLTFVPRPIVYENLNAKYGDGPEITRISGVGVGTNTVELKEGMHEAILNGEVVDGRITYEAGSGPVDIKIYDPRNVKDGNYRLELLGDYDTSDEGCRMLNTATWRLTNLNTEEVVVSEHSLENFNEQVLGELGITVSIGQSADVAEEPESENNGALSAEIVYEDASGEEWFSGLADGQPVPNRFFDYIQYEVPSTNNTIDPMQALSRIGTGIFSPFYMDKYTNAADPDNRPWFTPGYIGAHNATHRYNRIQDLNNVDIVLTKDKNKWSRCVVVERGEKEVFEQGYPGVGSTGHFKLRDSESVDKNGEADGSGIGMGWFPGYAIDVETGQRLNIFFGEHSSYNMENINGIKDSIPLGADMIWNPSDQVFIPTGDSGFFSTFNLIVGGQHIIYVTRQEYDECELLADKLQINTTPANIQKSLGLITWQGVPLLSTGSSLLSVEDGLIPNDVTIKMRVNNPYGKEPIIEFGNRNDCITKEEEPVYEFELKGAESTELAQEDYEGALENVNVVPNPYYGFSAYEFTQYSTTVKITNVPDKATVTIFSIDGKFIKQFKRDEFELLCGDSSNPGVPTMQTNPDIEWNLKNSKGIPVSSGVYLINVIAPELGEERTIKWFGIGRKFDPSGL